MAKGPRIGSNGALALVERTERVLDDLIPDNAISFTKRIEDIEHLVGNRLSVDEWMTVCARYRAANWAVSTHTHYIGDPGEGDGPYFRLSV